MIKNSVRSDSLPPFGSKYRRYRVLLKAPKITPVRQINAVKRLNGRNVYDAKVKIDHPAEPSPLEFQATISVDNIGAYHLRLFCKAFIRPPILRFDSKGKSHSNPEEGDALPARKIQTPHFQKYDADGRLVAYQTELLKLSEQVKIVQSEYSLGVTSFCQEAYLETSDGHCLVVHTEPSLFPLSRNDPLEGDDFK